MLDVRPAHHAATTWRDFFIHIATIVLGLCIAVGLEQTVEIFHHRNQLREAREQLEDEVRSNITIAKKDIAALNAAAVKLKRNIFILEQHRAGIKVPEKLDYTFDPGTKLRDGAIRSAEDTGALGLMPYNEIRRYRYFSTTIVNMDPAMLACFREYQQVTALLDRGHTQDQLTPEETRDLLTATTVALGDVRYAAQMFGFLSDALNAPFQSRN
jgi:hypothetical protein